ncbi:MAG: hypothetical protein K8M05_40915, partial [Deltaproteobacteria bacterium]|nr:hypothetical protein [Kofleriaceae bacterium]
AERVVVDADLAEKSSKGFGSLAIHHRLTRAELDELARARPALRQHKAWVEAVVTRLRPPPHVDWDLDLASRVAYLDELWAEVAPLPPSFNSLKAHVLYHRLACDLRAGTFDRDRLLAYLALPRRGTTYVRGAWLEKLEQGTVATLDHDFSRVTGLAAVAGDEALVRTYLAHFLRDEEPAAFGAYVEALWLERLRAETRLLAGDRDVDRWTSVLGAAAVTALRDRVELDFAPTNPRLFGRDTPVVLDVDIKHAGTLRVKVFRIDVAAHFHARGADVDTTLDLDGLAAGWEELRTWTAPPLHRVRTRFELTACERPGTYVVELIAGGKASRALVRKGDLRYTTRPSAAGIALTVLDEAGRGRPDASVWLGGREYQAREDGDVTLPFSTRASQTPALLVDGDLAVVASVQLPAETYALDAAILLDRQAVLPGRDATALVRACLTVAGAPTTVALLEEPYAEITVTDRAGVPATRRQPLVLADDADVELPIAVPENAASLAITVGGRARVVSEQRTVELVDEAAIEVGAMHAAIATEALYLERDADGFSLLLLGKTGEPRAGRAVSLQLRLRVVTFLWEVTLATDERGRIGLGRLPGVTGLHATTTTGLAQDFTVAPPSPPLATVMTAREGDDVLVPVAVDDLRGEAPPDWTLVELRGGAVAIDHGAGARLDAEVVDGHRH